MDNEPQRLHHAGMQVRAEHWLLTGVVGLVPTGCWVPHCEVFPEHCVGLDEAESSSGSGTESGSESTTGESTTESTSETGPEACLEDSECTDPSAPFCEMGMCVGCADAPEGACAELDASVPVCDEGNNTCVQCLPGDASACSGTTPVCDEASSSCVGCQWHEECPGTACRMKTGECFPDNGDNVFVVANASEIQAAINAIALLAPPQGVIVLYASNSSDNVTVPAGITVAILGEGFSSYWQGGDSNQALTVQAGAEVYIQGVRIANTQSLNGWGIVVSGGELWLDRSEVVNNDGGGVYVGSGGSAVIRNSFVGGDINDRHAIEIQNGTATISFTTLGAGFGTSSALGCADGTGTTVSNSILVSRSDANVVQCPNATITNSAIEMQAIGDNVTLGNMDTAWFANYANGDFHLSGLHPAEIDTAAIWQPGDPLVDIDGDPRPQDQTPTAAGADLP